MGLLFSFNLLKYAYNGSSDCSIKVWISNNDDGNKCIQTITKHNTLYEKLLTLYKTNFVAESFKNYNY